MAVTATRTPRDMSGWHMVPAPADDFFLYSSAAALVFNKLFFPTSDPLTGTLLAFTTYAIGFLARPIGGLIFGHYGDKIGRKKLLVISLLMMGGATFAMGLLPTYATIGIAAPILLTLLRLVQGFALGGEWGGAILMSIEHAPEGRRGLFGSIVALGLPAGIILSNLVFLIASTSVASAEFAAWAWRVPFIASGYGSGLPRAPSSLRRCTRTARGGCRSWTSCDRTPARC
jgi:MFS family permease